MRTAKLLATLLLGGAALAPALAAVPARAEILPPPASAMVDPATLASTSADYRQLLQRANDDLLKSLKANNPSITEDAVDHTKQPASLADWDWVKNSGYAVPADAYQKAGIAILEPFRTLPRSILAESEAQVTAINNAASLPQGEHALFDADGISFAYFLAEALGPKLGNAYLSAYEKGEIKKAAALMKASEVSTGAAKSYFNYPRPFLIDQNRIRLVLDEKIIADGEPYGATGGAFPSGHTNTGYTDTLVLAEMLPERFAALVARGAGYGYSRVVLGVHYPLDVMGSRMIAQHNVANLLADPGYVKLFDEAKNELRAALEKECGQPLAECAKAGSPADDPWAGEAVRSFYRFTMTYGLDRPGDTDVPMQVPADAETLLARLRPDLSADALRALIVRTALPSGYALDSADAKSGFWQRIDLYDAALLAQHAS